MPARAGPTPWSSNDFFADHMRKTQKGLKKDNIHWTLRGGYRHGKAPFEEHILLDERPRNQWDNKPKHYKTKTVTIPSTGKKVQVPDGLDLDYYFGEAVRGHHEVSGGKEITDRIAEYIDNAPWNEKYEISGMAGHISKLRYSPMRQLMEVTFSNNGSVVVYFSVPKALYSFLHNLAQSGGSSIGADKKPRHTLGIEFWNAVRIRGTVHGYRYEFSYTTMGESTSEGRGDKATVGGKWAARTVGFSQEDIDDLVDRMDRRGRGMDGYPKNGKPEEKDAWLRSKKVWS